MSSRFESYKRKTIVGHGYKKEGLGRRRKTGEDGDPKAPGGSWVQIWILGFGFVFGVRGSGFGVGVGVGVLENGGETGKEILYTHPRNLSFDGGMWYGKRAQEMGCLVGKLGMGCQGTGC